MSLRDKAGGILDTHVTWKDVEELLQEKYGPEIKFGPNKNVADIGAGRGFLSKICVINPDWSSDFSKLPSKLVLKICSQLALIEVCENVESEKQSREVHDCEVAVYNFLEKYRSPNLKTAEVYASRKFTSKQDLKGFLVMEMFENLHQIEIDQSITVDQLKQCIKSVAAYNAIGLKLTAEEQNSVVKNYFTNIGAGFLTKEMTATFCQSFRDFLGEKHSSLCDEIEKAADYLCSMEHFVELENLATELGMKPLLCHGDLWSANVLWHKMDGEVKLKAIIDLQTTHMGSVGVDLAYLICSYLSGPNRRSSTEDVLSLYYEYLLEECEGVVPFSLDQLKEAYERTLPFTVFTIVPCITTQFDKIMEKIENTDLRTRRRSEAEEKIVMFMEDGLARFRKYYKK